MNLLDKVKKANQHQPQRCVSKNLQLKEKSQT